MEDLYTGLLAKLANVTPSWMSGDTDGQFKECLNRKARCMKTYRDRHYTFLNYVQDDSMLALANSVLNISNDKLKV